jgi:glutathione S-transferase
MAIKLYGNPLSTCTQRVLTTANALKIQLEVVVIDLGKGEHKAPDYIKKHPWGKVPVLEDDGFIIYESRAICRYICLKYQTADSVQLYPTDVQQRALVEQYISVEQSYYNSGMEPLVGEAVFKKYHGGTPDHAVIAKHKETSEKSLAVYDKILEGKSYFVGEQLTLADVFHLPYGNCASVAGYGDLFEHPDRPNVNRWWKTISAHEAWIKTISGN